MDDVGTPREQPTHAERVLDGPGHDAERGPVDPAGPAVERFVERVAVRRGTSAEAERGGDELDLGPGAGERGRELVVVRRREGGGIGEDDVHWRSVDDGTRSLGGDGAPRPDVERLPRERVSAAPGGLPPAHDRARGRRRSRRRLSAGGPRLGAAAHRPLVGDASVRRGHARAALAGAVLEVGHAGAPGLLPVRARGPGERDPRCPAPRCDGPRPRAHLRPRTRAPARPCDPDCRDGRGDRGKPPRVERPRSSRRAPRRGGARGRVRGARRDARRRRGARRGLQRRRPLLDGYSDPGEGIDHVLVRGARPLSVAAWPHERRVQNGVVLSDHPVVEARLRIGGA